ncbi:hypothetical protein GCM10009819_13860 [Agromyces tropicus]|uniref:Uncharacterized protein n=1 Tax=Agromyces tropicus TaxID=555371 RepID=A0ABN2U8F1_9MICO
MDDLDDLDLRPDPKPGIDRRTLAKAAAWSVPAILVAAPAPAYAASPGGVSSASVIGSCNGTGRTGTIQVVLPNLPLGSIVQITLQHSGQGGFSATTDFTPSSQTGSTYLIEGTGGTFSGTFTITFNLGTNQQGTVTATVAAVSGVVVEGDTTGFVTKRHDGNSGNYNQCSAG